MRVLAMIIIYLHHMQYFIYVDKVCLCFINEWVHVTFCVIDSGVYAECSFGSIAGCAVLVAFLALMSLLTLMVSVLCLLHF